MNSKKYFDDVHFATYLGDLQKKYYEKSKKSFSDVDKEIAKVLLEVMKQYNREYKN